MPVVTCPWLRLRHDPVLCLAGAGHCWHRGRDWLGPVVRCLHCGLVSLSHTASHNQPMRSEIGASEDQWEAGMRGWCVAPTALALGILISVHPSVVLSSETVTSDQGLSQETGEQCTVTRGMLTSHRGLVTGG